MPFPVDFLDLPHEYPSEDRSIPAAHGVIVLGDFREEFLASLDVWNEHEYRQQWRQALLDLLKGADRAAIVTEYFGGPDRASHLVWWPMYRDLDKVHVHNNLLFFDQLAKPFDLGNTSASIPPRIIEDEDGNAISEWSFPLDDIKSFVAGSAR